MISCLAVQTCVPALSHSISFLITLYMKNSRKTASMTRALFTTHMEILLTYCKVVALLGSFGGEEKAQVMKKENSPGTEMFAKLMFCGEFRIWSVE